VFEDIPYQAVEPIPEEEYERLARDIKERGVIQPIVTDENGDILDGHHRAAIVEQLELDESKEPDYVVIGDLVEDREKLARAIKTNLLGRDVDSGVKSNAVEQYIEQTWPVDEESGAIAQIETQEEVAENLGVSSQTVMRVLRNFQEEIIKHDRLKAREYYRENPDASYREVARQVDASNATVTEWLKEDFDEGDDSEPEGEEEQTSLTATATGKDEAEASQELFKKAKEDNETAREQAEKTAKGKTNPKRANRKVEKQKNKEQREQKRQKQKKRVQQDYFDDDAVEPTLHVADAEDLPLSDNVVDLIITSPPYNLGHDNWKMGGEGREQRENGIGYQDDRNEREYQQWQLNVFQELYRVASDGASFFYNHKLRQIDGEVIHPMDWIRDDANPWTLRQEIVWDRESTHNHSPGIFWPIDERIYWMVKGEPKIPDDGTGMHSIWEFHGPKPDTDHPAPFPDELPRRCIESVGCEGDTIFDPFAGSFTTCEVAGKLGYESIGVDIDGSYVERKRNEWGLSND